jgi:hypothetical protein
VRKAMIWRLLRRPEASIQATCPSPIVEARRQISCTSDRPTSACTRSSAFQSRGSIPRHTWSTINVLRGKLLGFAHNAWHSVANGALATRRSVSCSAGNSLKKRPQDLVIAAQSLIWGRQLRNIHLLFVGSGELEWELRQSCHVVHDAETAGSLTPESSISADSPNALPPAFLRRIPISNGNFPRLCGRGLPSAAERPRRNVGVAGERGVGKRPTLPG